MRRHFGANYAPSVAHDQVLGGLGGRTAEEALAAGVTPREVWKVVCEAFDVPARQR